MIPRNCIFGIILALAASGSADVPEKCRPLTEKDNLACCEMPYVLNELDENGPNLYMECFQNATKNKLGDLKDDSPVLFDISVQECIDECVFKRTGLLTPTNELIEEKVKSSFLEEINLFEIWKGIAEPIIDNCMKLAKKTVRPESKCNSGSYQVYLCTMKDLYKNCPKKMWTDSKACTEEKELVDDCGVYMF